MSIFVRKMCTRPEKVLKKINITQNCFARHVTYALHVRYADAETIIAQSILSKPRSLDEIVNDFDELAAFALRLLATVYR